MLYIPQWVNEPVASYKTTTKLRVLPLGRVQDSSGDSFPPGLPSIEQTFKPVAGLMPLRIALIGRVVLLSNVLLVS
jgi:hypothetical protein